MGGYFASVRDLVSELLLNNSCVGFMRCALGSLELLPTHLGFKRYDGKNWYQYAPPYF